MQKLKIGLFAVNSSNGVSLSAHPERHQVNWKSIKNIVKMAEENNYDYMVPLTRTKGHGGETDPQGESFETFTYASAIASMTDKIQVFSTVLAPVVNPVMAAKMLSSIYHIGGRKNAVNMVCGWKKDELDALGIDVDMENRYEMAKEWIHIVKSLLISDKPLTFSGQFFSVNNTKCKPTVAELPDFTVAGFSPDGQQFARDNCDLLFTMINNIDTAKFRIADIKADTDIKVIIPCAVICRETEQQAQDFYIECADTYADTGAIENFSNALFHSNPINSIVQKQKQMEMALGAGSYPLIGTPEQIADEIEKLYEAGVNGILFSFINYEKEMPYFNDNVLPILKQKNII